MVSAAEKENRQLVAEHNRLRRRLGFRFDRIPFSGEASWYPPGRDTVEGDNEWLKFANDVYKNSKTPQEANDKIDRSKWGSHYTTA